jgi:hypothetical protein
LLFISCSMSLQKFCMARAVSFSDWYMCYTLGVFVRFVKSFPRLFLWVFLAGSSSRSGGVHTLLEVCGSLIASYCLLFLGMSLFSFFASCEATPNGFATRYPDEGVSPNRVANCRLDCSHDLIVRPHERSEVQPNYGNYLSIELSERQRTDARLFD